MTDESFRIDGLDFLRGLAVMGILLANIVLFALPSPAVFNPFTIGTNGPTDIVAWLLTFLFIDGKMRALFAMLFGASILLVMESAEMNGRDGLSAHRRRMLWLLPIGLAHYLLLWSGDILLSLAVCGLIATLFVRFETLGLIKLSLSFLLLQWLINIAAIVPGYCLRASAHAPNATASTRALWNNYLDVLGAGDSSVVTTELLRFRSGYLDILGARASDLPGDSIALLIHAVPEMLAFIALGMAMLKGGFLAGQWQAEQYRATWRRALIVGLVPMCALAGWVLMSRNVLAAQAVAFAWSLPLRLPLAIALAAIAMEIVARMPDGLLVGAVRSVGRLALSNYLLTSLVMTTVFYGYGLGLYGTLGRAQLIPVVLTMWVAMLMGSTIWRNRVGQGPAERLWRRLARGADR